jgi:nucleoside-diphosphate-sugar epimerase
MKLFCFGFGYTAAVLAERLSDRPDVQIAGTRTKADPSGQVPLAAFQGDGRPAEVAALLGGATHVLISIPPGLEGCPALLHFGKDLAASPSLQWVGYLSTVGVYGDAQGGWVDEATAIKPTSERALRRAQAESAWLAFGRETGNRVEVFRLPGIYGPARSVIDNLKTGTARRIVKPGQVFNRVHVADIAGALDAAMSLANVSHARGFNLFNITDDAPGPPQDVVAYGAELLGLPAPPEVPFSEARLSPMGISFYGESKRVKNTRMKTALGYQLLYPTYREGLLAIVRASCIG